MIRLIQVTATDSYIIQKDVQPTVDFTKDADAIRRATIGADERLLYEFEKQDIDGVDDERVVTLSHAIHSERRVKADGTVLQTWFVSFQAHVLASE